MSSRKIFMLVLLLGASVACVLPGIVPVTSTPVAVFPTLEASTASLLSTPVAPVQVEMLPPTPSSARVIVQRLKVAYMGLDGHRLIGSGCPGRDGMGSIENYHFVVSGVDIDRKVQRVLVTG